MLIICNYQAKTASILQKEAKMIEEIRLSLKDDQYPYTKITHTRHAVRAVCFNSDNKICLVHIKAIDQFGKRNYYELPGGGLKNSECHEEALKRELNEELGVEGVVGPKLGVVHDFYNLIEQENYSHYYLFKITKIGNQHLELDERRLIYRLVYVSIEEAIRLMKEQDEFGVSLLVKRRELPILELISDLIAKNALNL